MKHFLALFCLLFGLSGQAQVACDCAFFDPTKDPVAFRKDTTLQLIVSEYVLAKSVKTRLGPSCQVSKTYKIRGNLGEPILVFEGVLGLSPPQSFTLGIPLIPDAQQRYFYASSQALVCSSPGCNNCSILNGNCTGCCSSATGGNVALPMPLQKIQTNIEE